MKKTLAILLALTMLVSLTACGGSEPAEDNTGTTTSAVTTTTTTIVEGETTLATQTQAPTSAPAEDIPTHSEGEGKSAIPVGLWVGVSLSAVVVFLVGGVIAILVWRKKKQK